MLLQQQKPFANLETYQMQNCFCQEFLSLGYVYYAHSGVRITKVTLLGAKTIMLFKKAFMLAFKYISFSQSFLIFDKRDVGL